MKTTHLLACSAIALAVAAPASAATIDLVSVTGTWIATTPGAPDVTGQGTDTISWGGGVGKSSYNFTPVGGLPSTENENIPFTLGTFSHDNQPVFAPFLMTATLQVDWTVAVPSGGAHFSRTSFFDFTHDETLNNLDPCPYADGDPINDNGCADKVTFETSPLSETFQIGKTIYSLTLLGFEVDGVVQDFFLTKEQTLNTADLKAVFETSVIPLPAAGWMLLTALGGLGVAGYRRRKAA